MVQDICEVANLLHPHLLKPVGVAIEVEKPLYIIYPFMENRDIKTYLKEVQGTLGSMVSAIYPPVSLSAYSICSVYIR